MPETELGPSDRGARRLLACALGIASLLLLSGLGATLWGSEARWLVVSRGMARSGDAFTMAIGGESYADKPFGSYWLIVLAAWLMGGFSEAAGRLPGALAYVLTLVVTYRLGCRTLGARTGAVAALLLAASARLLFLADTASADPQQLLGITLALLLVLEACERGRLADFALLGVTAGLTTQMKGLPALALPAFAALLWTVLTRGWRRLSAGGVALSVLLGVGLALLPFVLARAATGDWEALALLWRESVVRAVDPFDHVEPWWFYLLNQFEFLAAWSLLLPAGLLLALTRLREARGEERGGLLARLRDSEAARRSAYPLFGYLAVLLFFSLSASRRAYYLMPIAPFAALLVADVLMAGAADAAGARGVTVMVALARRIGLALIGALGLVFGLLALVLGGSSLALESPPAALAEWQPTLLRIWSALPGWLVLCGAAVVPGALLLRAAFARAAQGPALTQMTLLGCFVAVLVQSTLLAMTLVIHLREAADPMPRFAAAVRAIVPEAELDSVAQSRSARVRYYLDPPPQPQLVPTRYRIVPTEFWPALQAEEPGWRVVRSPLLDAAVWDADSDEGHLLVERDAPR